MITTSAHAARVLDLSDEATLEDVQYVRRQLARKYHPDCSNDQERATRHMARINVAADTLTVHINSQAANISEPVRRDRASSSARSKAGQASSHSTASRRQPASAPPQARTAPDMDPHTRGGNARLHVQERAPQTVKSRTRLVTPAAVDIASVRLASTSYRNMLDWVGGVDTGPTVDIRVLSPYSALNRSIMK